MKLLPIDRLVSGSGNPSYNGRETSKSRPEKILILGIGNRMRGDDAIGCLVADALQDFTGLTVIDCGSAPENFIDKVVNYEPKRIIMVDACNFGAEPGKFQLFSERQIEKIYQNLISTHTLPLTLFVAMIKKQLDCEVQLLGIQPGNLEFGEGLSPKLEKAKKQIINYLKESIKDNERRNG